MEARDVFANRLMIGQMKEVFMEERRKHARFKSSTIMQYKDGLFTLQTDTMTKDVSLGGVCFFSEKKLKSGQVIKLKLFYDAKAPVKALKGKVIWSTTYKDEISKGYLNGLAIMR